MVLSLVRMLPLINYGLAWKIIFLAENVDF